MDSFEEAKRFCKDIDCCSYFFKNALEFNTIKQLKISYIKTNDKNKENQLNTKN